MLSLCLGAHIPAMGFRSVVLDLIGMIITGDFIQIPVACLLLVFIRRDENSLENQIR